MSSKSKYIAALALVGSSILPFLGAPVYAAEVTCDASAISQVGEVCYDDLASAIAAATSGQTVTLKNDKTESLVVAADKNIVLDLGGNTLTISGGDWDFVHGTLKIVNGSILSSDTYALLVKGNLTVGTGARIIANGAGSSAITVYDGAVLNVEDGDIEGAYGVFLNNTAANASTVNINGGNILGKNSNGEGGVGIFVGGNIKTGTGPTINITGGSIKAIHGTTGTVGQDDAQGIAQNGLSTITISGGTIEGDEAIGVKAGKLTITGGTLKGTGDYHNPADANFSGTESTGAAISITSNSSYADIDKVTISGGTITSTNGNAVYEGISSGASKLSDGDLTITGGTFTSPAGMTAVKATTVDDVMKGGVTTNAPATEDVEDGYDAFLIDGVYKILPVPEETEEDVEIFEGDYLTIDDIEDDFAGHFVAGSTNEDVVVYDTYYNATKEYLFRGIAVGDSTVTLKIEGVKGGVYTKTYNVTVKALEVIESVEFELGTPKAGMTVAQINETLVTTNNTQVSYEPSIRWFEYNEETNSYDYSTTRSALAEDYVFKAGKRYFAELEFWAKAGYTLTRETKFILNGEELDVLESWVSVTNDWGKLETSIDLYNDGTAEALAYLEYVADLKAPDSGRMTAEGGNANTDNTAAIVAAVMAGMVVLGFAVKAKRN